MTQDKTTTRIDLHGGHKDIIWNRILDKDDNKDAENETAPSDQPLITNPSEVSSTA